jgi:hypothetical protein
MGMAVGHRAAKGCGSRRLFHFALQRRHELLHPRLSVVLDFRCCDFNCGDLLVDWRGCGRRFGGFLAS